MTTEGEYEPSEYWSRRLADMPGLRGTGHVGYGERYNRWIYRRKAQVLARALKHVPSVDTALDLGSGIGWVIEQLIAHGAKQVTGVDISTATVEQLRQKFDRSTFYEVALGNEPLPIDGASVDCATLLDVAYHMVDDEPWEAMVADVARVVRLGGSFVVIDAFGEQEVRPANHVRFRAASRWDEVASANGFRVKVRLPCYRWLSRPRSGSAMSRLPGGIRGPIEFILEAVRPEPAHLHCTVYERRPA